MEKNVSEFPNMMRGTVVDNYDPEVKGRLKIYVPGVYSEELAKDPANLPWSEPCLTLFGGNWTNEREDDLNEETGVTTIPHTSSIPLNGAQVWVFFEKGCHNRPVHFAACQGGEGWHSEHRNQHVIKTDNVRIRIDENPTGANPALSGNETTTTQFDSYNSQCTHLSQDKQVSQMPTRTDIEIWNLEENGNALNVQVRGNVNIHVVGDVYTHIDGNVHETISGDIYRRHVGDLHYVHEGDEVITHTGKTTKNVEGNETIIRDGNRRETVSDDYRLTVEGNKKLVTEGQHDREVYGNDLDIVAGEATKIVAGGVLETYAGEHKEMAKARKLYTTDDIIHASVSGDMYRQTLLPSKTINDVVSTGGSINHDVSTVPVYPD